MYKVQKVHLENLQVNNMYKLLNGKEYAQELKKLIQDEIKLVSVEELPVLGILQVGNLEESNIYIKHKLSSASELGFHTKLIKLAENSDFNEIKEAILELDKTTDAFIIQLPMQTNKIKDPKELLNLIPKHKDIDGLSHLNLNGDYSQFQTFLPATPLGIILLLKKYNIDLENSIIGVVGQSQIVGAPLANYLEQNGAKVNRYDKYSSKSNLSENNIIIVATGVRDCILAKEVKDGSVIVDVGIHRINGKIYGDLNFDEFKDKASYITPVPGGVGPMTIISLILNLIKSKAIVNEEFRLKTKKIINIF
ncbi:tetrahydrofolate dehydrogenase/cyclohydrolase catalytic domain-containing protein [Metamycoplasma spumans]|uniref:tetrahydrofolate dehydrogenase/cyclohydrolase catalytic domain-containing protein n=1 Tax=Metamycoplasma spumans TaxID=92406 RepID=UPI0034DD3192